MSRFFAGMLCGAALLFVLMRYHVVHGNNGVILVPKVSNSLSHIYTDTRDFGLQDWKEHQTLAAAIMRSNHQSSGQPLNSQQQLGTTVREALGSLLGS